MQHVAHIEQELTRGLTSLGRHVAKGGVFGGISRRIVVGGGWCSAIRRVSVGCFGPVLFACFARHFLWTGSPTVLVVHSSSDTGLPQIAQAKVVRRSTIGRALPAQLIVELNEVKRMESHRPW